MDARVGDLVIVLSYLIQLPFPRVIASTCLPFTFNKSDFPGS
jgi:hypothetical protein